MAKILIVDDSDSLRRQLRSDLERHQMTVHEAASGTKGLDILKSDPHFDLIICDLNMPEMDGLTMAEKVVTDQHLFNIPIFMLTTETAKELKVRGKSIGIKAWVTKPYDLPSLIKAIELTLKKK